jgi:hypothetical protein
MDAPLNRTALALAAKLGLALPALLAAGLASAALPPDEITFPARNGAVRFTHRNHFAGHVDGCRVCHAPRGRYSRQLPHMYGKEAAHEFCLGCHRRREPAPMRCSQCHDSDAGRAPALVPPGEVDPRAAPSESWPPRLEQIQALREPPPAAVAPSPTPTPAPTPPRPPTPPPAPAPAPPPNVSPPSVALSPRPSAPAEPASGRMLTPAESEMQMVRQIEEAEARERAAAERARRKAQ